MIRLLIASILFFIPLGGFADEKQREIENEAVNLVIKKNKCFFLSGSLIRNNERLLSTLFGEVRATFPRLNLY